MKNIYVIAGGTMVHISPHFALTAPAYGTVGTEIANRLHRAIHKSEGDAKTCDEFYAMLEEDDANTPEAPYRVVPIFTRLASGQRPETGGYWAKQAVEAAGLKYVETNDDLAKLVDHLLDQADTRCIIMAAAVCDWEPTFLEGRYPNPNLIGGFESMTKLGVAQTGFGKDQRRLRTRGDHGEPQYLRLGMKPADKILGRIRAGEKGRKDVFLVSFKTTAHATKEETYAAGLKSLKGSSSNLVLANDVVNHHNVVVTPEEFPYYAETREKALDTLCEMILGRLDLTFTRTVVVPGERADLRDLHDSRHIPSNFLPVLQFLIEAGAYKPLPWADKTSGHFGCQVWHRDYARISSIRKVNHNRALEEGVAKILGTSEDGQIVAMGGKPSVGEHTQAQIYAEINERQAAEDPECQVHSIVHFHCPLRRVDPINIGGLQGVFTDIPMRPQKMFECGSDQCGTNTATGMAHMYSLNQTRVKGLWAVHLDAHGPNIAFHKDIPPGVVIDFIKQHWDLETKSGGNLA